LYDDTIAVQASDWFNALAIAKPSDKHPNGLIAAGGKETIVYVKEPGTTSDSDPYRILPRHAHTISCLAFSEDGSRLISGGWDSQVFVWDVEAGEVVAELLGHTMTVWGILIYDQKFVFTACADKNIRMFDINGKLLRTIEGHTDVPRCFCKIPEGHWSGAAFASAGNDEIIRLWSLDGAPMGELHGHEAYIYSIAISPNGDIVSAGEDRTVRVFRDGKCIQTITHPAISIWSVAVCEETGDIVSGASDKTIRVFSRDPERHADAEVCLNRCQDALIPMDVCFDVANVLIRDVPGYQVFRREHQDVCHSCRDRQPEHALQEGGSSRPWLVDIPATLTAICRTVTMRLYLI
jgi:phospholipase A-2-activating protein